MRRSSERAILECEECGERLVLGDPDEMLLQHERSSNAIVGMTFPWLTV
jgi:hypothetical protein